MRSLACLALAAALHAHDTKQSQKPSKAQPNLDRAAKLTKALKGTVKAKQQCCTKKADACEICIRTHGSCACARNVAAGKGACGQCFASWKSGRGGMPGIQPDSITILAAVNQHYDKQPTNAELIGEIETEFLQAKRILVSEKRYACCVRGGCAECAKERNCPCGADLAKGKGVCGECLDGWKSGKGAFAGIDPQEVTLAPMEAMDTAGMSPGVGESSGWYASGTSQQPREAGMNMITFRRGSWTLMANAQAFFVFTEQTGPRGKSKMFSPNWGMLMASRRLGPGTLTLRSMLSLEPATITGKRYPLLFATGETANGIPIVNGQHPHDLFMELAASYQIRLGERTALNFYGGPRGEPALGPPAFPHRASASENPIAVIAHHIQDSTHIANSVVTAGITHRALTWEVSGFGGREPGEQRWQLDRAKIDSLSTRLTVTPSTRWSGQVSMGRINDREAKHPGRPSFRTTASLTYARQFTRSGSWASTLVWGRNHDLEYTQPPSTLPAFFRSATGSADPVLREFLSSNTAQDGPPAGVTGANGGSPGRSFALKSGQEPTRPKHFVVVPTRIPGQIYNSYLAESTLRLGANWFWGRIENADRDSTLLYEESPLVLLVDERRFGRVQAATIGYERELTRSAKYLRPGIGTQLTVFRSPAGLAPVLGANPVGVQVFLKVRVGPPSR